MSPFPVKGDPYGERRQSISFASSLSIPTDLKTVYQWYLAVAIFTTFQALNNAPSPFSKNTHRGIK